MGESFNCTRQFLQQISNQNLHNNYNNSNNNNNNNNYNSNNNNNENYSLLNNLNTTGDCFPEYWKELREQKQFCDAIITLSSESNHKIHRIVLSSCSQYFKAIFTYNSNTNFSPLGKKRTTKTKRNDLNSNCRGIGGSGGDGGSCSITSGGGGDLLRNNQNGSNEITEVSLDVSDSTMEAILDYAYTGTCLINWSNVEDLLASSDRYQIIGIVRICCKFLHEQLTPENCIGIYLFAKNYFCKELENLAKLYILRNFTNVTEKSCELKQLDGPELKNILSDECLNVKSEVIVFDAVKYWVECDPQKRLKWVAELLPCVRFGLLGNKSFRERILNWKYITESMDFQKIILPLQCKPRIPNKVIMVVGGWVQGGPTNIIEVYDTRADLWLRMRHTDTMRAYHGVCTIDQKIYVLGGFNGFIHYNSMRCFDPVEYKWEEKACMYHPRCYVSVAVLERKIYALGGYDGHTRLNSVERYDPDKNQWEILSPMRKLRSDAAATTFGDHIYVVGGFNGSEVLNSCEMYDKDIDSWTLISFMLNPRSGIGLVACNDYLYAIGGFSGNSRLNSVERYSPKNQKWCAVADMMVPRSNFATAVVDGIIYVIGGFNGSSPISFVEQYDTSQNIWKAATQMNNSRSAPSACVLRDLPNIKAYSLQCFDMGDNSPCYLKCESPNRERLLEFGVENIRIRDDFEISDNYIIETYNNTENINNLVVDGAPERLMDNNFHNFH